MTTVKRKNKPTLYQPGDMLALKMRFKPTPGVIDQFGPENRLVMVVRAKAHGYQVLDPQTLELGFLPADAEGNPSGAIFHVIYTCPHEAFES